MTNVFAITAYVQLISGKEIASTDYIEAQTKIEAIQSAENYFLDAPENTAVLWGNCGAQAFMANTIVSFSLECIGVLDAEHEVNAAVFEYITRVKNLIPKSIPVEGDTLG